MALVVMNNNMFFLSRNISRISNSSTFAFLLLIFVGSIINLGLGANIQNIYGQGENSEDNNENATENEDQQKMEGNNNLKNSLDDNDNKDGSSLLLQQENECNNITLNGPGYIGNDGCSYPCPANSNNNKIQSECPQQSSASASASSPTVSGNLSLSTIQKNAVISLSHSLIPSEPLIPGEPMTPLSDLNTAPKTTFQETDAVNSPSHSLIPGEPMTPLSDLNTAKDSTS